MVERFFYFHHPQRLAIAVRYFSTTLNPRVYWT